MTPAVIVLRRLVCNPWRVHDQNDTTQNDTYFIECLQMLPVLPRLRHLSTLIKEVSKICEVHHDYLDGRVVGEKSVRKKEDYSSCDETHVH